MTGEHRRTLSATTLVGDHVVNHEGEDLGTIEDLMIDLQDGKVAYGVLSFGGILGLGDKLFAIPWESLHVDEEHKRFVLDADKDRLKDAPGFDKEHWPDTASPQFRETTHHYWAGGGTTAHATPPPTGVGGLGGPAGTDRGPGHLV